MTAAEVLAELERDNPRVRRLDLVVFGGHLRAYAEASSNVARNGAIVAHPRTGAPIDNPYLKVQAAAGAALTKMNRVEADRVLDLLLAAFERAAEADEPEQDDSTGPA